MQNSIFSTYKQGENRVTAAFLSVLSHLNLTSLSNIFNAILDDSGIDVLTFQNQAKTKNKKDKIPDGRIYSNFDWVIETKTVAKVDWANQVQGHLDAYKGANCLVITAGTTSKN
jgi:hypothetical protein